MRNSSSDDYLTAWVARCWAILDGEDPDARANFTLTIPVPRRRRMRLVSAVQSARAAGATVGLEWVSADSMLTWLMYRWWPQCVLTAQGEVIQVTPVLQETIEIASALNRSWLLRFVYQGAA